MRESGDGGAHEGAPPRCQIYRPAGCAERSVRNAARTSDESSAGCSHAAKWPPRSWTLKKISLGYANSVQLRGAGYSSSGKTLTATGMVRPLDRKSTRL